MHVKTFVIAMLPQQLDPILQQLTSAAAPEKRAEIKQQLVDCINYLLVHDFPRLVQVLYRVDVNESRLKELLQQQPQTDAAVLLADILLQRQEEKIKTRSSFLYDNDVPEEDKW